MKKAVLIFVCTLLLYAFVLPQSVFAVSAAGYGITAYDAKVVISEDNIYAVTETISVYFNDERHGIYRDIPVSDTCRVYDISAGGDLFTSENDGSTVFIRIGDPDKLITGDKTYSISYKMALADTSKSSDEVYYNIIGTGWDADISNVTFSVTMPKDLEAACVGICTGDGSGTDYAPEGLSYDVQGNIVSGSMQHLDPYEGLTMRIELPEGYFSKQRELPDWMGKIVMSALLYILAGL